MDELVEIINQHLKDKQANDIADTYLIDKLEELIFSNEKYKFIAEDLELIRNYSIELLDLTNGKLFFKVINHDCLSQQTYAIKTKDFCELLVDEPSWNDDKLVNGKRYRKNSLAHDKELLKRAKHGNIVTRLKPKKWKFGLPWYMQEFRVESKKLKKFRKKVYIETHFHDGMFKEGTGRNKVRKLIHNALLESNKSLKENESLQNNNELQNISSDLATPFHRDEYTYKY